MTKLRLIHDGQLTLNLGGENKRVKNIELQVLLLEDCVMFLQVLLITFLENYDSQNVLPSETR